MAADVQHADSVIRVKNLRLRTYVGFNPEEREKRQDIVVNLIIHYNSAEAAAGDIVEAALDYKAITKTIIQYVESNRFLLLERLSQDILGIIMQAPQVSEACVEVDKPHALRFADSVSLTQRAVRNPVSV